MRTIFLFDLDSTISKQEILPTIAKKIGKEDDMRQLTEMTMMGDIPFLESFSSRVNLLKEIPIKEVSKLVEDILLNEKLVKFLKDNHDDCYIVTSNLDVWIYDLMKKIDMSDHFYSSSALLKNNEISGISEVLIKDAVIKKMHKMKNTYIVAVGDGSNDRNMVEKADIGIAFGGVRNIAPTLLEVADYAICEEEKLVSFLNLLKEKGNE